MTHWCLRPRGKERLRWVRLGETAYELRKQNLLFCKRTVPGVFSIRM